MRHKLTANDRFDTPRQRRINPHQIRRHRHIPLPSDPHDRIALLHQKGFSEARQTHAAPVRHLKQNRPISGSGIPGLQHHKVGCKAHHPLLIYRRTVYITNDLVGRKLWVDRKMSPRHYTLVALSGIPARYQINLLHRPWQRQGEQQQTQEPHLLSPFQIFGDVRYTLHTVKHMRARMNFHPQHIRRA